MNSKAEQHLALARSYIARGDEFYRRADVEYLREATPEEIDELISDPDVRDKLGRAMDIIYRKEQKAKEAKRLARGEREAIAPAASYYIRLMRKSGWNLRNIAAELNRRAIPSLTVRGGKWNAEAVKSVQVYQRNHDDTSGAYPGAASAA